MKKLILLICLMVFSANAQKNKTLNISEKSHGNGAVLGLDLMGGNNKGVTILPSPAGDHILISVAGTQREKRQITFVDATGQPVLRMANRTENTFMVNVSDFPKGLYFIEIASGSRSYRKKWMRQ